MTTFKALDISPVPTPGPDAEPPELFRGIYGMPMFIRIPCPDLQASVAFWTRGLGFFELFSIPEHLVHLWRWTFQDVLLVPGPAEAPTGPQVGFACVLSQLDELAAACRAFPACDVQGPTNTPSNTRDLTVTTPEGTRVVLTAAKPLVVGSAEEAGLARLVDAHEHGVLLSGEEQRAAFGDRWRPEWVDQARGRWGDSTQWAQFAEGSAGRTTE